MGKIMINATNIGIIFDEICSVFFEYDGGYIALAQDDGGIIIGKDEPDNVVYVDFGDVKYFLQKDNIEIIIDEGAQLGMDFERHFLISFTPDTVQYAELEKALEHIFSSLD